MSRCTGCGYMYADCDENGTPIGFEHCHFEGPDGWAPCEQDEQYEEDWSDEEYEYECWLDEQAREDEEFYEEYGAPYDYKEF